MTTPNRDRQRERERERETNYPSHTSGSGSGSGVVMTTPKRRMNIIFSLSFMRESTFDNLDFFRSPKNKTLKKKLSNEGFYYNRVENRVKCCYDCISYETESHGVKNNDGPIPHSDMCPYQVPVARSKVFFAPIASLFFERERLNTFIEFPYAWPDVSTPQVLAKEGFYYNRASDYVVCAFCHKKYSKFLGATSFKHSFCSNLANISLAMSSILDDLLPSASDHYPLYYTEKEKCPWLNNNENKVSYQHLSVFKFKPPIHSEYILAQTRSESFQDWPLIRTKQTPKELALAGFFYEGEYSNHNNFPRMLLTSFSFNRYNFYLSLSLSLSLCKEINE